MHEVMEFVQESKSTIFLALELASGGELFDRITVDEGTDEAVARDDGRVLIERVDLRAIRGQ